ncbi:MAG: ABC transporter ATP-binding protein [Lachnospiraceae bacterium]|nr:ABC transporter ATP-binding protein [Lachnospiraceae bacterium]
MRGISKRFDTTWANTDVDFDLYKGEIVSLLGENGSGKTTLMNILAGLYYPDKGHIFVNGRAVVIDSPAGAYALGIGMVHQHFKLVDVFTAWENIILGEEGKYDVAKAKERIREICDRYGFVVDPDKKIYNMTVSEKQTVEIVKVIFRGADILILDEPTAVLTPQETERLFDVMRNMRQDGKSIIIITHKLNEVMAISDRVVILRGGRYIGQLETAKTNPQEMTDMMVGHSVVLDIERPEPVNTVKRLIVKDLNVTDADGVKKVSDVNFYMNSGEILGIAGISGSGQKELLEAIAGIQKTDSGSVLYVDDDGNEKELVGMHPRDIRELGVELSFVPEDRLGMGLVGNMDIAENMMLRTFGESHKWFTDRAKPKKIAGNVVESLEISTPGLNTPVRRLSGGNIQKVLVGREISSHPKVLLTAYAVRGLDINSSYKIYDLINDQKKKGVAVLFVGENLDVLMQISDKIMVLCDGRVSDIVDAKKITKNEIGLLMTSLEGAGHSEQ